MDEGPRIGRSLLEAFANALLERALPRIRQWLAQRLGPHAELRALELDGARVHLVDARLPLGERAVLQVARATFTTHPEELALGRPPIRLERLEGRLEITHEGGAPGDWCQTTPEGFRSATGPDRRSGRRVDAEHRRGGTGGEPGLSRPKDEERSFDTSLVRGEVSFVGAEQARGDAWVDGRLAVREVTIDGARFAGSARLTVTSERFAIEDATVSSSSDERARIELGAGGTFGAGSYGVEHARLEAHAITAGLMMELARLVRGVDLPSLPIDEAGRASMSAALERDGAMHALATIEAPGARAELRGHGRVERDGALTGEAEGTLDPALLTLRSARMRGEPLALRATLSGKSSSPVIRFEATSPRVEPIAGLALARVRASCTIDDGVTFEARARTERGSISLTRSRTGELAAKLERVALAPLRSIVKAAWLHALGVDEGQLFAELEGTSEALVGSVHVETPRASVTLAPLRAAALGLRRIELAGTMRAAVRGEALAQLLARGVALAGAIELELDLTRACLISGALEDVRARGVARAKALTVRVERRGELAISDASASIELDRDTLHLEEARAQLLGGIVRARAFVRQRRLVVTELALEALRGLTPWITDLPIDREDVVDAALTRDEGALRGALTVRTERSEMEVRAVIADDGGLAGTRLAGTIVVADLAPLVREWSIRPDDRAQWRLEGAIEGSLLSPAFALDARSDEQPLWLVTQTESVLLDTEDAHARVRIEGGRIAWTELALSLYGGALRSRGSSALGIVSAHVELEGVDAAALPLTRGTLGAHLGGRLAATLDVLRGRADAIACGRVRVEAPVYRVLEHAAGTLRSLDLTLPDPHGTAPLGAQVELGLTGWRVSELDARLAELVISGSIDIGREGGLRGRLVVRPAASWLSRSTYLGPVSQLVTEVPVRVSGSMGSPRLEASALSALDGVLERSPIGSVLHAITDELGPPEPERAPRDPLRLLSTDALLDRLAGEPDEPEPLRELLGRGLDVEDVAARLRRR